MKRGLRFKVLVLVAAFFLMGVTSIGVYSVVRFHNEVINVSHEKLKSDLELGKAYLNEKIPGEWSNNDGNLYKGNEKINGNFVVVDEIGSFTGDTVTIFQGNTRVATNVKKSDGTRAIGTTVAKNVEDTILKQGQNYFGEADVVGTTNQTAYEPIKNAKGEIIGIWYVGVPNTPYEQMTVNMRNSVIILGLAELLIAMVLLWLIIGRSLRSLQTVNESISLVAQGDLSSNKLTIKSNDEIGQMANVINSMTQNLRTLVKNISGATEQVAASSEELTSSSEQLAQMANHISVSITEVATGADEQLQAANETSAVVEQMSASTQQIAANANRVAAQSAMAEDKAKDGEKAVNKAIAQMNQIETTVMASAQVVTKLGERSKEIGEIVDTISGIADQTNLLALNAAIEAARAGEQGRGFAVVAEEVRKLAEQSQEAAKMIAELIREILGDTEQAVVAINNGTREVKTGAKVVTNAETAFHEIAGLITEVAGQVKEISATMEQMASGTQAIVGSVQKIDELGKRSTGEAQSVSAAAEEQLASMEEITSSSQSLAILAQDLQTAVAGFKI